MALSLIFAATLLSQSQAKTPNFLVIVVDDLQYTQSWSHSAPPGNELATQTMTYYDIPTPHIQEMLDDGGVAIPRSYAGAPKCSPSRFSLLTGRYPSRGKFAIKTGGNMGTLKYGTTVNVPTTSVYGDDIIYNVYNTLKNDANNPYYTGMVGKWHLWSDDAAEDLLGCSGLKQNPSESLYNECVALMKSRGFDYVDAWYFTNIPNPPKTYSHNPEWIVSNAKKAINAGRDSGKPWFLYVALTINHRPSALDALENHDIDESTKGTLTGSDIPRDSGMRARSEILADVNALGLPKREKDKFAGTMWVDEAVGALLSHLKDIGEYDETFITFGSDHGAAKGLIYEQGSRISYFVRYPPLFNPQNNRKTPYIMPNDFIVSNVDFAAVVFELADITPPDGYVLDGVDWTKDAVSIINGGQSSGCCTERFMDFENSYSVITTDYQYIFRAFLDSSASNWGALDDYADGKDMEQVYDLNNDPNQQQNAIDDGSKANLYCDFQEKMYEYVENVACADPNDCTYPELSYCASREPNPAPVVSPTKPPTTASVSMCCTANVAMSLAMPNCAAIMTDFDGETKQRRKCFNARKTGIDAATGQQVCKWVPCNQVGSCVEADGSTQVGKGRGRNKPLEGCATHLSEDECGGDCVWQIGYPGDNSGSNAAMTQEKRALENPSATNGNGNGNGNDIVTKGLYIGAAAVFIVALIGAGSYFAFKRASAKERFVNNAMNSMEDVTVDGDNTTIEMLSTSTPASIEPVAE